MSKLLKLQGSVSLQMLHHHLKMKTSIKGHTNNKKIQSVETSLLRHVSLSKGQKSQHFHFIDMAVLENWGISPA